MSKLSIACQQNNGPLNTGRLTQLCGMVCLSMYLFMQAWKEEFSEDIFIFASFPVIHKKEQCLVTLVEKGTV
jgi:hypothetical protein